MPAAHFARCLKLKLFYGAPPPAEPVVSVINKNIPRADFLHGGCVHPAAHPASVPRQSRHPCPKLAVCPRCGVRLPRQVSERLSAPVHAIRAFPDRTGHTIPLVHLIRNVQDRRHPVPNLSTAFLRVAMCPTIGYSHFRVPL